MSFCHLPSMTEPFSRNPPTLLPRGLSPLSLHLSQKHHITENWKEDSRVPRVLLGPRFQLDSIHIQVRKLESDPKVCRTNFTTDCRKESASERLRESCAPGDGRETGPCTGELTQGSLIPITFGLEIQWGCARFGSTYTKLQRG